MRPQNMRKVGNVASNQIYNPENRKPPIPVDADEVDSAMERFIRQKYINNVVRDSGKPRSPLSDEGTPPPLPPKNSSKFGFRSASSIFPLSSRSKKEAKHAAVLQHAHTFSPGQIQGHRSSQAFGASVTHVSPEDMDRKLAQLRDMGFQDAERNTTVLKGVNGSLERAIESLVRLGEGGRRSPAPPRTAPQERTVRNARSLTPLTPSSPGLGIDLQASGQNPLATPSSTSTNPFDMMPPAQPQTAQSTGSLQNNNPYSTSTNAYGNPVQQQEWFAQAFQNMNLNSPPQPLFPHHTGGSAPQPQTHFGFQHQQVPSAPVSPQAFNLMGFQNGMTYPQPGFVQQQPMGYNPFHSLPTSPVQQQPPIQQHLLVSNGQPQSGFANNPYARSPTSIASPTLGQIPEQSQPSFQNSQSLQSSPVGTNPFYSAPMPSVPQASNNPFSQPPQQYTQAPRVDKASIMALYGQPQLSPQSPVAGFQPTQTPTIHENQALQISPSQTTAPQSFQQPQGASQLTGSKNPFMNSGGGVASAPANQFAPNRNASRDSMNLGMDLAWTNGRHSPDAFASLSARHGR